MTDAVSCAAAPALALANLRLHPDELLGHLEDRLVAGDVLDAYLLAAGLRQVVEDTLEPDAWRLADAQRVLGGAPARVAAGVAAAASHARRLRDAELRAWDGRLAVLLDLLADGVVAGAPPSGAALRAGEVAARLPRDPRLLAAVTRPPTAFRDFDQHPDDLRELAARLDRAAPAGAIAVVGLRTSGSVLAPLTAAFLRAAGRTASSLTMRPYVPVGPVTRRALRRVPTIALTDDAPASGGSVAAAARALERIAGPGAAVWIVVQLLSEQPALPERLRDRPAVLLPWAEWSIGTRLAEPHVMEALAHLCPDRTIERVERMNALPGVARGHAGARYRVQEADETWLVEAEGAGLGYLGRSALAVQRALGDRVAPTLGIVNGVAFRELPGDGAPPPDAGLLVAGVPEYAAARQTRLPLPVDPMVALAGQDPVWEVAANLLATAFGRAWRPARLLAVDRLTQRLLRAPRPAIVDGHMEAGAWGVAADGRLVKGRAAERAYSNRNLAHADVAWDVAAAAVTWPDLADALRDGFATASGAPIDAERWFVLRLVALWAAERDGVLDRHAARRAKSRVLQRYLAEVYLDGLPAGDGPVCALDLDGVLETETLGFLGTSPAGALALRALRAHGYRPILVSGRSAGELAERCRAYGLHAGVAEYGAAIVSAGAVVTTCTPDEATAVERLRRAVTAHPGVELGPDHTHIVRAWTRDEAGRRRPLGEAVLAALVAGGPLRAVHGDDQTDIVPARVDKGTGLEAAVAVEPLALAVGDTAEDLPMLRRAVRAWAPHNATAPVRAADVRVARGAFQAGTAEAVGALLGHAPGTCAVCRAEDAGPDRRRLLRLLAAREGGGRSMATTLLALAAEVRRP
ncbi:MAG: hypothetical protein QOF76_3380 [Solirubrobacteraceae bacterium]|nr:hypothetical protein [Solirubrobacteraceae bacterium]